MARRGVAPVNNGGRTRLRGRLIPVDRRLLSTSTYIPSFRSLAHGSSLAKAVCGLAGATWVRACRLRTAFVARRAEPVCGCRRFVLDSRLGASNSAWPFRGRTCLCLQAANAVRWSTNSASAAAGSCGVRARRRGDRFFELRLSSAPPAPEGGVGGAQDSGARVCACSL
jgi:hypothetical protein